MSNRLTDVELRDIALYSGSLTGCGSPDCPAETCSLAIRARNTERLIAEYKAQSETLRLLFDWACQYGAALKPTAGSADSFGDGMRAAKGQIQAILSRIKP